MIKLLFKPVDMIAGMVGGLLAGLIFKRVWRAIGRGDAPKPTDERRGWADILLAAVLHGAIFALVKAAVDRGVAEGTRRLSNCQWLFRSLMTCTFGDVGSAGAGVPPEQ